MLKIWKWELKETDEQTISLPAGAKILTVQVQSRTPCLWALCDVEVGIAAPRRISIYGTGHPIPSAPGRYISTFQLLEGRLVFHVFEAD